MKILVDTSVWIEYFRANKAYLDLFNLIDKESIITTELIEAELLQGAKSERETLYIENYLSSLQKIPVTNLIRESAKISSKMKWFNHGISLVDAFLIYSAWHYKLKIWTLDKNLVKVAGESFIYKR